MGFFANTLKNLSLLLGAAGSALCIHVWLEEPEMPQSMIEKY